MLNEKRNEILEMSFDFALEIIELTKYLKMNKEFVISNQLLKSGTSIGANVSEAQAAHGLPTTGLRYFTVYGPWGRPDMAMYLFADGIMKEKPIKVYNHGKMKRDFTFIDDIVFGTKKALEKKYLCEVFNLGNHKSENLMDMLGIIEECIGKKAEIDFQPIQSGDVLESFADIEKSTKLLNYNPTTNIQEGVPQFIDWYKYYSSLDK
jgi:UDP-glucuronate 4-epimerase